MKEIKGSLLVFVSAILFGSYGLWSVLLGPDFGVFFQGYVRSAMVLIILIPICYFSGSWIKMQKDDWKYFAWCTVFAVFTQAPLYYAFQNAGVGISSLVFFSVFVITSYLVGKLMLSENMNSVKIISLILAFIGLFFIFYTSLGVFSVFALIMASVNGIASGGEVSTTKLIPGKFPAIQTSVIIWFAIFITHLPMSLLFGEAQLLPQLNVSWLAMFAFAVAGLLAFYLVIEGFKLVDASVGGLIGLLEIVFAILFGWAVFNEQVTVSIMFGSVIILLAAALPSLSDILKNKGKVV